MGTAAVVSMFNNPLIIRVRLPFHVLTYNYFYTLSDRENWENQEWNVLRNHCNSVFFKHLVHAFNRDQKPKPCLESWGYDNDFNEKQLQIPIDELKDFQKWSMECIRSPVHRNIDYALRVFNRMVEMHRLFSIEDFNDMLGRIARMKYYFEVITLIKQMESLGIAPSVDTLTILIYCFCHLKRVDFGFSVLARILKLGYKPNIITMNNLVKGLCIQGEFDGAVRLVDEMEKIGYEPDLVSYNSLIDGYCLQNKIDDAVKVFNMMVEMGYSPCIISYNTLINGYCKNKRIDEAMRLFHEMSNKKIKPNVVTYSTLIGGFCRVGRPQTAVKLFRKMQNFGQHPNPQTCAILLDGLCDL